MAVTYTNHKGKTYYLCCRSDSKKQNQYFFARRPSDNPVEVVPVGYEIQESEAGQVALVKSKKTAPVPLPTPKQPSTHKTPLTPTSASTRKTNPTINVNKTICPICSQLFPPHEFKWHIQDNHHQYAQALTVSPSLQNNPKQTVKAKVEPKQSTSKKVRGAQGKALHIEQITCGWCYEIIYEAWLPSGKNGYYEDKDLKTRHHCTRPVHWDPDHSGGPFEF